MEKAIKELACIQLPHPSLHTQIPFLLNVMPAVIKAKYANNPMLEHTLSVRSQYVAFVADFTSLLTALVQQLDRLGSRLSFAVPSTIGTAEEDVFWSLWVFLVAACSAFDEATEKGPDLYSHEQQAFYGPLYFAFNSLMSWLLSISRSPAWVLMQARHGKHSRACELIACLEQPTKCLVNLSFAPT